MTLPSAPVCTDHARTCKPREAGSDPSVLARSWFALFAYEVWPSNGHDFPFQAGIEDGVTYLLAPYSKLAELRKAALSAEFTGTLRPVLWLDKKLELGVIPRGKWLLIDNGGSCVMDGPRFSSMLPIRGPEEFEAKVRLMSALTHRADPKAF